MYQYWHNTLSHYLYKNKLNLQYTQAYTLYITMNIHGIHAIQPHKESTF